MRGGNRTRKEEKAVVCKGLYPNEIRVSRLRLSRLAVALPFESSDKEVFSSREYHRERERERIHHRTSFFGSRRLIDQDKG